jgi:glycosyltransferase involved in cell wall biosynthesis
LRARLQEERSADRDEILFVGSLSYVPNIDAVLFFCREILPLIRAKKGERVIFRIVGVWGAKALGSVLGQPGVELMGYQEKLAPLYAKACMAVVPLRAGSGTRLKILEAFAYGRVVISTSIGAEGLEVTNRKNIVLADDATSFAEACIEMIDRPELATKICEEASRLHRERYSEEALLRCYRWIETTKNG